MNNDKFSGQVRFLNDICFASFMSLTKKESKEFDADFLNLIKKITIKMNQANSYQTKVVANQRFSTNRYFKMVAFFDFTPQQDGLIIVDEYKELNLDEYLDSINDEKKLIGEDFKKL